MHIPDGYLTPVTYGGFWVAMAPVWFYASRKIKGVLSTARIPYLAMASAFSLLVMVFAIPLPGGTTGHLCGAALIAILLGPSAGILAVSVSLAIQAAVFGDGGVTALGANCFNIALAGSVTGYAVYRILSGGLKKLIPDKAGRLEVVSAGAAAYISINASALLTALELGLQPHIHGGYFPYGFKVTIPAVMMAHLTVVGLLEAVMTGLIFQVVRRWPAFQCS